MRRVALLALILFATATTIPAYGTASVRTEECGNTPNGGIITCMYDEAGNVVAISTGTAPVDLATHNSNASPATIYHSYTRFVSLPDGQFCVTTGYYEANSPLPLDDISNAPGAHPGGGGFNNLYDLAPCPDQPRTANGPSPFATAAVLAARYWEQIALPRPTPTIAPGRAITGKLAYLETKGETTHVYASRMMGNQLQIQAAGSYTVDWGDGSSSGPYRFEGGPWPDGRITHEYVDVGTYNVVVTERWMARWTLGSDSGTLRTLQTSGAINNFPVGQIQAVIVR